jgi:nucleoid DNA-binding protein
MNIVVEVIAAYLLSNRRLVVPAFGAFMVKESGERVFSELLRTDDGVLASLLREKGLNEMEVAVMVDRFIFEVRHELEQYGYCRLGEIGTLRIEPSTKVLRLYPPVQGEMPKQTPYVPKPIQPTESEEVVVAPKEESVTNEEPKIETPNTVSAPSTPKKQLKTRKKFDFVMVVAVIILVVALLGIGYGWYVSNLAEVDDAAMEELRVAPNMINE